MDINDLRIGVTVISLVLFMLLVRHTWNRARRSEHEMAANLPFSGDLLDTTERQRQETST